MAAEKDAMLVIPTDWTEEAVMALYNEIIEEYPVDLSHVYLAGFSGGARKAIEIAINNPTVFAAVNVGGNGNAGYENVDEDKIEQASAYKIPVITMNGMYDISMVYPLSVESEKGPDFTRSENQIAGTNMWAQINHVDLHLTREKSADITESSDDIVESTLGIPCDSTSIIDLDETQYYIGNLNDKDGVNTMRFVAILEQPHWPTPSFSKVAWDFFSQFGRDTETGALIVEK